MQLYLNPKHSNPKTLNPYKETLISLYRNNSLSYLARSLGFSSTNLSTNTRIISHLNNVKLNVLLLPLLFLGLLLFLFLLLLFVVIVTLLLLLLLFLVMAKAMGRGGDRFHLGSS